MTVDSQGTQMARNGVGTFFVWKRGPKISPNQLQLIEINIPMITAGMADRVVQRGRNMPITNSAANGPTNMLKNLGIRSTRVGCRSSGCFSASTLSAADMAATIYSALGIDYEKFLYTPQNRPVRILPECEPIRELWS